MVYISDVLDMYDFARSLDNGYIRVQKHPQHPLYIYNYTEKAVFNREWNTATLACRGLIATEHDELVARPFPKFFNHGEAADPYTHDDGWGHVISDKLDGSLGIAYHTPDGQRAVATRGSFASEQAVWATAALNDVAWDWPSHKTPLFEIIYPSNRIVLDYGGLEALVYLGYVDNLSGHIYPSNMPPGIGSEPWPGLKAERLLNIEVDRPGREGVVVMYIASNTLVKYKQEDYLILHKLVTNLNARTVYEALLAGTALEDLCAPFPDEFHQWIRDVHFELWEDAEATEDNAHSLYGYVVSELNDANPAWTRADFARYVRDEFPSMSAYLFALLDEQYTKVREMALKSVRPGPDDFGRPVKDGLAPW